MVIVLVASLLLFRAVGAFGVTALASWVVCTRLALALMFLFTGMAHFTRARHGMARMVPRGFGNAMAMVYLTGVCEIAGAIGILIPRTRTLAGACLILLLIAMFPANAKAVREKLNVAGRPATPLVPRTAMQIVFIGLVWWSTLSGYSPAILGKLQAGGAAVRESRVVTCDHPERQWDSNGTRRVGFMRGKCRRI